MRPYCAHSDNLHSGAETSHSTKPRSAKARETKTGRREIAGQSTYGGMVACFLEPILKPGL